MVEALGASFSMIVRPLRVSCLVGVEGRINGESRKRISLDGSQVQSQAAGQVSGKRSSGKSPLTIVRRTERGEVGG